MVSDGSQRTVNGNQKAAVAMRAVQGIEAGAYASLVGKQLIPKAELIGAWMQIAAAYVGMQTDRAKRFYGIIDNQGVWSMLCRAHKMRDRELLRSIPGNVYLRDIRRMTREFPDRVQWIWVKSHTYRTGPIYRAHDKCDRECGRIAEEGDDEVQKMFVKRDWQFIMVDETGQRIEGDVRAQVRIRMNEYRWESQKARGSREHVE